jgi:AraC-like DNA-binding protein
MQSAPTKLSFSTESIPERDRLGHWREIFALAIAHMDWRPLTDRPIEQEATVHRVPGLGIIDGIRNSGGFQSRRTPELIARGDDVLALHLQLSGKFIISQLGRQTEVGPGDAVLASSADVCTATTLPDSQFVTVSLPRHLLAPMVAAVQPQVCVRLPRELEPLGLLRSYVLAVLKTDALENPALRDLVVTHIYDLVAATLVPGRVHSQARRGGVAAARLQAIKADVLSNLGNERLSEAAIAQRHRLTPRYLRMLFAAEATTYSEYLRSTRLARAHQLLSDRRNCERTIASIAYEAGFGDLSHFNRLFRQRYGAPPSTIRRRR